MKNAIEAFDQIINDMPQSQAAFNIAKEAVISTMRTERVTGEGVFWSYLNDRDMGFTKNTDKEKFKAVQAITLEDVKATQEKWVKGRNYTYAILGDKNDLDTEFLETLGSVKYLTLEEIFGY